MKFRQKTSVENKGLPGSEGIVESNQNATKQAANKRRLPRKRFLLVPGLIIILIIAGFVAYKVYEQHSVPASTKASNAFNASSLALSKNNNTQALAEAKKALSYAPHNLQDILLVANLTVSENPSAAKPYFARALNEFRQQSNPDVSGKRPIVYFDAGFMAERAGDTNSAIHYYQEASKAVSNQSDSYDRGVAEQAQVILKGLK